MDDPKPVEPKDRPRMSARRYSSKIIKAGALLADTKTLLAHWDTMATVQVNLIRIRENNDFAKASRSRVEDILAIFRQRYLVERDVTQALVALVKDRVDSASLDRILFYHAAKWSGRRRWCEALVTTRGRLR